MTIVIPGMVTISLLSLFYCSMLPETARKARMQAFERQYIAPTGDFMTTGVNVRKIRSRRLSARSRWDMGSSWMYS